MSREIIHRKSGAAIRLGEECGSAAVLIEQEDVPDDRRVFDETDNPHDALVLRASRGLSANFVMTAMRTKRLGGVMSPGRPNIPEPCPVGLIFNPEKSCASAILLFMPT